MRAVLLALVLAWGGQALAIDTEAAFDDPVLQHRYETLNRELRCLVCQNQSLADSDAELAHDLRAEVYGMMQDGKSDKQIIEFLVARYGDFVLYKPPVKPSTYLIWFGPFLLLLVAAVLLLRAVRRQKATPAPEITAEERARLDALLGGKAPEQDKQQ